MTDKHQIVFYPVGNGDTSQVVLSQGRRVLFDFCQRPNAESADTPEIDLKKRLKEELEAAGRDYFDVVAFTHADADHIMGSTEFFELQHAAKYQGEDRIKIRQLWVPAAMVLQSASNDQQSHEFVILRQEARHRLLEGKGILVFSKPQALMDWLEPKLKERGEPATARDHLFVDAGSFRLKWERHNEFSSYTFFRHIEAGDADEDNALLKLPAAWRNWPPKDRASRHAAPCLSIV